MQSTDFLKALGSSVRSNAHERTPASSTYAPGAPSFDEMLHKAQQGQLNSRLPVKIAKGVNITLSEDQLNRIADAADVAEANGAGRALILIDGKAIRLDVATRTVIGEAQSTSTAAMPDIDSVISAAPGNPASAGVNPQGTQDPIQPMTPHPSGALLPPPSFNPASLNPQLLAQLNTK